MHDYLWYKTSFNDSLNLRLISSSDVRKKPNCFLNKFDSSKLG